MDPCSIFLLFFRNIIPIKCFFLLGGVSLSFAPPSPKVDSHFERKFNVALNFFFFKKLKGLKGALLWAVGYLTVEVAFTHQQHVERSGSSGAFSLLPTTMAAG